MKIMCWTPDNAAPGMPKPRAGQTQKRKAPSEDAHSFLAGKLFDDRGHRMGPSHAAKGGRRWRYYVSRAVLKGRKQDAGSVSRVPAAGVLGRQSSHSA